MSGPSILQRLGVARKLQAFMKLTKDGFSKRTLTEYPSMAISNLVCMACVGFGMVSIMMSDTDMRAHYCNTYTVYRDDNPIVEKLRPPSDYPPKWAPADLESR